MIAVCAFVVLLLTAHCFWNSHSKITRFFSFFFLITGSLPLIFAFIKEGSFLTFTLAALGWGSALAFIPALLFLILPKLSSDYYEFVSDHPSHMNSDLLIQALILFWGILLGAIAGCCSLLFHALFKNKLSESELLFHTDTALTTFQLVTASIVRLMLLYQITIGFISLPMWITAGLCFWFPIK